MRLMTAEVEKAFARYPLYSQERDRDPIVVVKFFHPCSRYTLYVTEGQPLAPEESPTGREGDWRFYGYCLSPLGPDCDEWGYSLLSELESLRDRVGLGIERDSDFPLAQRRLGEVRSEAARGA